MMKQTDKLVYTDNGWGEWVGGEGCGQLLLHQSEMHLKLRNFN